MSQNIAKRSEDYRLHRSLSAFNNLCGPIEYFEYQDSSISMNIRNI